jgi:hypothetical protein
MYKIGYMLFNKEVGLLSTFLLSVSTFHILWSQQVRDYSLLVCLTLLGTLLFIVSLRQNKFGFYIWYTIVGILLCSIHPYGIFVIFAHSLTLFIFKRRIENKIAWTISQLTILSAFLLLLVYYSLTLDLFAYMAKPSIRDLIETIKTFSYGGSRLETGGLGMEINPKLLLIPCVLFYMYLFLWCIGIMSFKSTKKEIDAGVRGLNMALSNCFNTNSGKVSFLLLWMFIPIVLPFLFSYSFFSIYLIRGTVIALPPFFIIIGKGISYLRKRQFITITIVIISVVSIFSLKNLYNPNPKESWRELVSYVKDNIERGDVIVLAPVNQALPFMYYYYYDRKEIYQAMFSYEKEIIYYQPCSKRSSEFNFGSRKKDGQKEPVKIFNISNHVTVIGIKENADFIKGGVLLKLAKEANNIWFIVSPDWIGSYNSDVLRDYIDSRYSLKSEKRYVNPGAIVYSYKINLNKKLIN